MPASTSANSSAVRASNSVARIPVVPLASSSAAMMSASLVAAMRAAIDSASSTEIRPARCARNANSPGRANRAAKPAARAPSTSATAINSISAGAPTQEISSESSPVKLAPASIHIANTGQAHASPSTVVIRARAFSTPRRVGTAPSSDFAAARTPGPDARTSARTPRPGGDATATMVSRTATTAQRSLYFFCACWRSFDRSSAFSYMRPRKSCFFLPSTGFAEKSIASTCFLMMRPSTMPMHVEVRM